MTRGDLAQVRHLLSKGASVTARSEAGRTPLLIAAANDGSAEIARLIVENDADVEARDGSGACERDGERVALWTL